MKAKKEQRWSFISESDGRLVQMEHERKMEVLSFWGFIVCLLGEGVMLVMLLSLPTPHGMLRTSPLDQEYLSMVQGVIKMNMWIYALVTFSFLIMFLRSKFKEKKLLKELLATVEQEHPKY